MYTLRFIFVIHYNRFFFYGITRRISKTKRWRICDTQHEITSKRTNDIENLTKMFFSSLDWRRWSSFVYYYGSKGPNTWIDVMTFENSIINSLSSWHIHARKQWFVLIMIKQKNRRKKNIVCYSMYTFYVTECVLKLKVILINGKRQ